MSLREGNREESDGRREKVCDEEERVKEGPWGAGGALGRSEGPWGGQGAASHGMQAALETEKARNTLPRSLQKEPTLPTFDFGLMKQISDF